MTKGESILIEQVSNGFIVTPKEITGLTKKQDDIRVFNELGELTDWLQSHFGGQAQLKAIK